MKIKIILSTLLAIILLLTLPLISAVQYDTITQEQKKHAYDSIQSYIREKLQQSIKINKNNQDQTALSSDNLENPTRLIQPLKLILRILIKTLLLPLRVALRIIVKLVFLPLKIVLLPLKILFLPVTLLLLPVKLLIKTFLFILKIITLPAKLLANIVSILIPSRDICRY
mgnify:CR=1 FL=1